MTLTTEQQEWVDALRSGRWPQHIGELAERTGGPGRCCLGVACDLSGLGTWKREPGGKRMAYMTLTGTMPAAVMVKIGMRTREGMFHAVPMDWADGLPRETWDKLREFIVRAKSVQGMLSLVRLNDEGFTFDEIADVIEADPPGLFVEREEAGHGDV